MEEENKKPEQQINYKPQEIEGEEYPLEKVDLTKLNRELSERGFASSDGQLSNSRTGKKDLVSMIRGTKERQHALMNPRETSSGQASYLSLQNQIGDISLRNKKIERAVKMQIMGMKGMTGSLQYVVWDFYHSKVKGEKIETAEQIISAQTRAVERVITDLDIVARSIEFKDRKLDHYYNLGVGKIIEKANDRGKVLTEINEGKKIMEDIERAFREHDLSPIQKLEYQRAYRNARVEFERKFYGLDLGNNAIEWIRNEQPLLDTLGQICRAYSHALRKTGQEARMMLTHMENVVSPYIDMLRHQHIQPRMDGEIKKLFSLASNMDRALRENTGEIVEKASRSSLFAEGYRERALTLEEVYKDIESPISIAFSNVENRVSGYLGE